MGYGYDTAFSGQFTLNRPLDAETQRILKGLNETRRCTYRGVDKDVYGVDGEFYFGDEPHPFTPEARALGVAYNRPPATQPGLKCGWRPNTVGTAIEWDGVAQFSEYVEWLEYLIARVLQPDKYVLRGTVSWTGKASGDMGKIIVLNNVVRVKVAHIVYVSRNRKGQVTSEKSQPSLIVE